MKRKLKQISLTQYNHIVIKGGNDDINNNNNNNNNNVSLLNKKENKKNEIKRTRESYFKNKNNKLEKQFKKDQNIINNNNNLFFKNVIGTVDGRTTPNKSWIELMMQRYGGYLKSLFDSRTTHLICEQLPDFKLKKLEKMKRTRPKIVHPQWVVDCVNQQKLLPTAPYAILGSKIQKTVISDYFNNNINTNRKKRKIISIDIDESDGSDDDDYDTNDNIEIIYIQNNNNNNNNNNNKIDNIILNENNSNKNIPENILYFFNKNNNKRDFNIIREWYINEIDKIINKDEKNHIINQIIQLFLKYHFYDYLIIFLKLLKRFNNNINSYLKSIYKIKKIKLNI